MTEEFDHVIALLRSGTPDEWEALCRTIPGFPNGTDDFVGRRSITHAVVEGSKASVEWMLTKGVELDFRDGEGYTPVLTAIERRTKDKYEVLEALLRAGASANLRGINDWTPAHMAAARDDVEALKILVRYKANLAIRTEIDDFATPLEEARTLGKTKAAKYLETI